MGRMKEEWLKKKYENTTHRGTFDTFKGLLKPIADELEVGIEGKYLSEILNDVIVKIKELKE